MSTCTTPGCGYQHGLVDGLCDVCRLADEILLYDSDEIRRVLNRVHTRGRRLDFGPAPHHDRVLIVVLVVPKGAEGPEVHPEVKVHVVEPNSAHAEAFWQDIGRPQDGQQEGQEGAVDASNPRACVHLDTPTDEMVKLMRRIMALPVEPNGCRLWTGARDGRGYGAAKFAGKVRGAHRISAALFLGMPINSPLEVCHRCDTPACVNPGCLFLGTHKDNMADASAKGRMSTPKTREPWKPTPGHWALIRRNLGMPAQDGDDALIDDFIERLGAVAEPYPEMYPNPS